MNLLFNNRLVSIASKLLMGCFVVLAYGLIQGHSASAATCTFASVGTSDWNTPGNWTGCGGVPSSTSDVVIPASTTTHMSANGAAKNVTLSAASSILQLGDQTLAVFGNWSNAGTLTPGTGTVIFRGTGNLGAEANFYNLTIYTSTTVTLTGQVTSTHDVVLADGILALGANTLHVGRNWTDLAVYIGGSWTSGALLQGDTGTVDFNGTGDQSIGHEEYFNKVTVSKSTGIVYLTGRVIVGGTLVTNRSSVLNAADQYLRVDGAATIGSGTMVTSTSGTLVFSFTVTNAGSIGSISGNKQFDAVINNTGGVLDVGSGYTTTTNFSVVGTVNGNSGTLVIGTGGWAVGGTFNRGTGTVKYGGSTNTVRGGYDYNNLIIDENDGSIATADANVTVYGTYRVALGSTFDLSTRNLSVTGATTNSGTTTSTSGTLTFTGAVTNSGAIGSVDGDKMFGSTLANSGTLDIGSGIATTTGSVTGAGTINGNTGTLVILADFTAGTFNSGVDTATVKFNGAVNQSIKGLAFNDVIVEKTAGTVTFITTDAFIGGTLGVWAGTLSAGSVNLTVLDNATIIPGGMVTSTTGNLDFISAVGNSGNIGSSSGDIFFESPLLNNGTLDVGSGTVTTTNTAFVAAGTINGNNGTLVITDSWPTGGTFNRGTGTVRYVGATPQDVMGEYVYNNLVIDKSAGTATLDSHATTTNFTLASGTLAVADKIFYVPGNYGNAGLVTRTTGKIKHTASYKNFVNASGVTQTSYTTPGAIYLEVKDDNRNMNGALAETLTVPLAVNAAGGSDSETVTLTETGVATGIFRSGLVGLYTGTSIVPGNGEVVISASGVGTETYTDNQDAADTGATTATLTYSTGVVTPPGGGGGGGGGGLPPVTTQFQSETSDPNRAAYLNNLALMNLPVNSLVKLPDDNNGATQEDSAVYYIGSDGKRHAFPNSKIYFTWYKDFSGIRIITLDQLASIPLGTNVRYKPGSRMVKFTTDPKVYAVDANGVLRWVKTEAAAKALYGDNWNTFIDDLSDAFFSNYSFGKDIETSSDFNVSQALGLEQSISENLIKTS
ncbi:MAG: beta strand repeat-containing protein [Patescibacteria group bacterium]